ncbi:MFS transporter [Bradyrhizobium sp. CCBAU 53415]|uniref:MFS transporter n=1 Tax=Bradyrhizobium sp. CCBAU 53415 TaxID=1325119 RepID=UPI0023065760|nr:MFS transporter [Bradyrhizobium sp. CCBAU 53415]MDA9467508.1 major facilitator transporter [Bradyrhizobium sp. CCBAU 53415]
MHQPAASNTPSAVLENPVSKTVFAKVYWRIIPLLLIASMIAFLDRINIGFAQLQMKQTLPFDDAVYGVGAGIFFIGYFLFEVPSNLLLERIGARKTLLRIMVLWGLAVTATMFVTTPLQFYAARFFLGAFEAGFAPGVLLYLTYWYPSARRGQVIAILLSAPPLVMFIAGPLSGAILKYLDGVSGLCGWQWLFVIQGLPAPILGILVYYLLKDKPSQASWLSREEKALLQDALQRDKGNIVKATSGTFGQMLQDPKIYMLSLVCFLLLGANYTMVFWMPTLIHSWGVTDPFMIGIYHAISNAAGIVCMILIGRHSDAGHERRWHYVSCVMIAAGGLIAIMLLQGTFVGSILALSFAVIGFVSAPPLFYALASEYLSAGAVAGGLALITSLGNLGPAVGPSINGLIVRNTGDNIYGIYFVMALYLLSGAVLVLTMRPLATAPHGSDSQPTNETAKATPCT